MKNTHYIYLFLLLIQPLNELSAQVGFGKECWCNDYVQALPSAIESNQKIRKKSGYEPLFDSLYNGIRYIQKVRCLDLGYYGYSRLSLDFSQFPCLRCLIFPPEGQLGFSIFDQAKEFEKMRRLWYLYLQDVTTLPFEIFHIPRLRVLYLSSSPHLDVKSLENILLQKPHLRELGLMDCNLKNISAAVLEIPSLRVLNLNYNRDLERNSLNKTLSQMPQLRILSLVGCDLKTIPSAVLEISSLKVLHLGNNPNLDPDSLQKMLLQMPHLRELDLSSCDLDTIPGWLKERKGIRRVVLSFNKIPEEEIEKFRKETGIKTELKIKQPRVKVKKYRGVRYWFVPKELKNWDWGND
ncbi:MAG: hypothetical protein SF052_17260 [Bacteroidia bacterium]|nr:hypothetical protein [Bacteroidia bacterium]